MKKMVVEECSLKQLFFFRILEMLDHEKREWKVDVNIGFWKCWAIFRADILKFSKRNDMSVFDGSSRQLFTLSFDDHSPHLEDYLWLKNRKEKSSSNSFLNRKSWLAQKSVLLPNVSTLSRFDLLTEFLLKGYTKFPDIHFTHFHNVWKLLKMSHFWVFNVGIFPHFLSD